ncbi:hypothetical protein AB0942_22825 [Streptomyces nodosus]|uniref:hypothetical protein n=1 Tax=Streptomyces nodosus TaxID=40318 RepID=UPI0034514DEB
MFALERGATGFYDPRDGPLPRTDTHALRAAWHASARAAGGRAGEWTEQQYPRTYHTASVAGRGGLHLALCHAYLPLVAYVVGPCFRHVHEFRDSSAWSRPFTESGFTVLSPEQLNTPLGDVDTAVLTDAEWREIRFWEATMLGGVLFNSWD